MKITELASLILESSPNPNNKNLRYIEGLIKEQLHLRSYDMLLKEVDEEDLEDPENNDIPVDTETEPEIQTEPEVDVEPETEPESELEPDATTDIPTTEPKTTPTPRKGPDAKIEPEVEPKIITISQQQARELLSYKGKIFGAIFRKKDGTRRVLNGMTGVRKYTSGGQLPYSPKDKGVIPVYDLKIGNGPKGYRMINVDGLEALRINGKQYKIDRSLKNSEKLQEIRVNIPTKYIVYEDENSLVRYINYKNHKFFGDVYITNDLRVGKKYFIIMRKDNEEYFDLLPKQGDSKYFSIPESNYIIKNIELQEIKVNNPTLPSTFPIKINSMEEWKRIKPYLNKKGYKIESEGFFHSGFPSYLFSSQGKDICYTINQIYAINYTKENNTKNI